MKDQFKPYHYQIMIKLIFGKNSFFQLEKTFFFKYKGIYIYNVTLWNMNFENGSYESYVYNIYTTFLTDEQTIQSIAISHILSILESGLGEGVKFL